MHAYVAYLSLYSRQDISGYEISYEHIVRKLLIKHLVNHDLQCSNYYNKKLYLNKIWIE